MSRSRVRHFLRRSGTPFIWVTGGALAFCLLLVMAMIGLILWLGLCNFWPSELVRFELLDGRKLLGEIQVRERIPGQEAGAADPKYRLKLKQANRDLYANQDFLWIEESLIRSRQLPEDAVVIERLEYGNFFGQLGGVRDGTQRLAEGAQASHALLEELLPRARELRAETLRLELDQIGAVNHRKETLRLRAKRLQLEGIQAGPELEAIREESAALEQQHHQLAEQLRALRAKQTVMLRLVEVNGKTKDLNLAEVVRLYQPNRMGLLAKLGLYGSRWWEFLTADPRESNTEGGVFPAIFGTVMMVFLMSLLAAPLGILAAFHLREYSKQGLLISIVRIAVNNLAGVPSIVFGVFGVGFFIYGIGGFVDALFYPEALPAPTFGTGGILWASLTLALLTVPVVIVATEEGLAAIPNSMREGALALGATKFETTWAVVLPAVLPSILTGMILAMARAAGEVAPLMITGAVKLAPSLPLDGHFPYFHPDRKFMHLGFHIYDVGFQSPNVDASRPMVFTTTLLLLGTVLALNVGAIWLRGRLRRSLTVSAV